jgi:2'-5' RNA ligase
VKNRRLFFALWPTDAVRAQLDALMQAHAALGRPIAARNLHVTAVFLGAVPAERVDFVTAAAKLTRTGKFMLHLERVEFWRRSQLICLIAERTPPQLLALVDGLRGELRQRGFELRDHDTFRPHVTLVRDVGDIPHFAAAEAKWDIRGNEECPHVQWPVESFALVESKVGQRGSEYTVLEEWRLA